MHGTAAEFDRFDREMWGPHCSGRLKCNDVYYVIGNDVWDWNVK